MRASRMEVSSGKSVDARVTSVPVGGRPTPSPRRLLRACRHGRGGRTCRVRGFRYATILVELTVYVLGGRLRAGDLGGITPWAAGGR